MYSAACHVHTHTSLPQGTGWLVAAQEGDSFLLSFSLGTGCGEVRGRVRSWVPAPFLSLWCPGPRQRSPHRRTCCPGARGPM